MLGDMYELGKDERDLHRSVAECITYPITHLCTLGEKGKWISEALLEGNSGTIEVSAFEEISY
ncbi:hypothetical protein KHA80_19235 [Anaerobacillus sp. HL2]|nr:hypothetical protein KHA80_19235 [Anaerobacillus sp. HL2]